MLVAFVSWLAGLKTAVFSGKDVGGTCVNRGCVPSKALLAASGRVREMKDDHHLEGMGIKVRANERLHTRTRTLSRSVTNRFRVPDEAQREY